MGFETGDKPIKTIIQQTPDFKQSLDNYHHRVNEMGVQIKTYADELASVQAKLAQAKIDLQAQYSKKVESLGIDIAILQSNITELQAQSDTLSKEIQTKQDLKNAISTDNITEHQRLNDSWAEFHLAVEAYLKDKDKVDWAQKSLFDANEQLNKMKSDFESLKASTLAGLDQKVAEANELMESAKIAQADAAGVLQKANTAIDNSTCQINELQDALAKATPILARADEIQALAEKNLKIQADNDAQALQNQKDADQIKVARVALNNLKHELDAREVTISAAEQKIGNM
jgi:chromosome segregation ATPase